MDEKLTKENTLLVFKNKRIIITGDTGFKGSWLSLWLANLGAKILGISLEPKQKNDHYNIINLNKFIEHKTINICNYNELKNEIINFDPEIIFHLAAQPLVKYSYENSKETFETNVLGSVNILEIAKHCNSLRALIYVTSDKCYKNKEWIWGYRENDELGGKDPYSSSKAAAEIIFHSYQESYFKHNNHLGMASVRAGNVIGGGDWSTNRIVPDCMRSLRANEPIYIRNPNSTRPWQHVLEPLYGYLLLCINLLSEPKKYSGSWNFGPNMGNFKTVKELANKIIHYWGNGTIEESVNNLNQPEANLLQLNCDKAYQQLSWKPTYNFDETIEITVEWYKNYFEKNCAETTSKQINSFMRLH